METTIERKPSPEVVNDELYYYRARYMRPDLGRFVSMDPLGMVDGTNVSIYAKNDSIFINDPNGLAAVQCSGPQPTPRPPPYNGPIPTPPPVPLPTAPPNPGPPCPNDFWPCVEKCYNDAIIGGGSSVLISAGIQFCKKIPNFVGAAVWTGNGAVYCGCLWACKPLAGCF